MKGEIRRLSIVYDKDKVLSGKIKHILKPAFTIPWKIGDRALLFHHNRVLIGIAKIVKITKYSLEDIEKKKIYRMLDKTWEEWQESRKNLTSRDDAWHLLEWGAVKVFDTSLGD